MATKNSNLEKNFLWNSVGSTLYAFTSLAFLVIVTRINSLDEAGVFTFAFSNACVFLIIGSYAGRVFQVTDRDKRITENDFFWNRLFAILGMMIAGIVFGVLKGYGWYKFLIVQALIVFKALEALAEFYYGIMQKRNNIQLAGKSLSIKAVLSVASFLVTETLTKNILLSTVVMIVLVLLVIVLYDSRKARELGFEIKRLDLGKATIIFKTGFFVFVLNILTQYLINAPKYAIDDILPSGEQTIFGIVSMPATVMVLVSGFLIHPVITEIKDLIRIKDYKKLNGIAKRICILVAAIGLLCVIGAFFLGVPIFKIIYGVDTSDYRAVLVLMLIGATLYGVAFVLENILIAFRELKVQAVAFFVSSVVAFLAAKILVVKKGCFGGAGAYLLSMAILAILYCVLYVGVVKRKRKLAEVKNAKS